MPMTPQEFRDDADAEQHLIRHLRRMLLVCYYQDTVSEHTITEQHIADAFTHNARFRRHLDLQGINPDTLFAFRGMRKVRVIFPTASPPRMDGAPASRSRQRWTD